MNILRLIKLKQLNGDFDHLNGEEKFFFSLFNNLYSVKKGDNYYFLNVDEKWYYFHYDLKTNIFWCSYNKVWSVFESKYGLNHDEIKELIRYILVNHLNLVGVAPFRCDVESLVQMKEYLNLVKQTH